MPKERGLRFFDVFCLGLNSIIGSGIYVFPGTLYALVGPASIAAFAVCALLLAPVALCYAELGGMFRGSGGSYLYAREAFGREVGFGMGFISWIASVLSVATIAAALSSQLGYFHPVFSRPESVKAAAVCGIVFFGALNYRGIQLGAWAVDVLTGAKVVPLVIFVLAGAFFAKGGRYLPFFSGERRFGYAVFLCIWALQGFEVAPVPAGETRRPERDVPWAVVGSLLAAGLLYALIQFVAVGAYPSLSPGERPLADAAAHFMGPWGGVLLAAGGVLSMLGFVAGDALGSPRYLSALGEMDFRRLKLAEFHPRFETPHRSILWTTGLGVLLILAFDFTRLIDLTTLAVVSQYFSTCLALCVLRLRRPDIPRTFRVPWFWATACAGGLVSLWLMTQVSAKEAAFSAALLALGYVLRRVA